MKRTIVILTPEPEPRNLFFDVVGDEKDFESLKFHLLMNSKSFLDVDKHQAIKCLSWLTKHAN